MRWNLLNTYDKIYILDLHGNSNVPESIPNGYKDENVFDIKEGVSITFLSKKKSSDKLASVYHYDIYGDRNQKYAFLDRNSLSNIQFLELHPSSPYYFLYKRDEANKKEYELGFNLSSLFSKKSTGYYTSCDDLVLSDNYEQLASKISSHLDGK